MSAKASAGTATASEFAEAVVASGRTVVDASGVKRKPGETAHLLPADLPRLRALGYIVADDDISAVRIEGPTIRAADGPTVRLA